MKSLVVTRAPLSVVLGALFAVLGFSLPAAARAPNYAGAAVTVELPIASAATWIEVQHPGGRTDAHVVGSLLVVVENRTAQTRTYTVRGAAYGVAWWDASTSPPSPVALVLSRASGHMSLDAPPLGEAVFDLGGTARLPSLELPAGPYMLQRVVAFGFTGSGSYIAHFDGWLGGRVRMTPADMGGR